MWIKNNKKLLGKVLPLVALLVIVAALASGCYGRQQPKGWSGVTVAGDTLYVASIDGKLAALNAADGTRLRPDSILGGTDDDVAVYGSPVLHGDLVYVGGYNGKVYALNAESGALRWVYPREDSLEPIVGGLAVVGDRLFFGDSEGKVYILDAATGDVIAEPFQAQDKIWTAPAVGEDTLYFGSFDKNLYAIDAADGSLKWQFRAGGAVSSAPMLSDGTVYIGSFDTHLYAVNAADGTLKWRSQADAKGWFWATPLAYDGVIYAPCLDGKVYLLDAGSGMEIAAAVDLGSPIISAPVVVSGRVVVAAQGGDVYFLNANDRQTGVLFNVGEDQEIVAPLAAGDGVVYIHAQTEKADAVYAVKTDTGEAAWLPVVLSTK